MTSDPHFPTFSAEPDDNPGQAEVDESEFLDEDEDDPLYAHTWDVIEETAAGRPRSGGALLLIITAGLFALSFLTDFDMTSVAILIGVVLFHELGHLAAMKIFGYQDLRIFFIPFFGGAASGRKHAAPPWQQGIVLLAGPVPGILLAVPLWYLRDAIHAPNELVIMLLGINVFNLLPFVPLDGGRLLQLTIFGRHPLLETLFRGFAVACLGLLALVSTSIVLGIVAFAMLTSLPISYRRACRRDEIKRDHPNMPADLQDLGPYWRRLLYDSACDVLRTSAKQPKGTSKVLANTIRQLHEEIVTPQPGPITTVLLLWAYVGSGGLGLAAGLLMAWQAGAQNQGQPGPAAAPAAEVVSARFM